VHLPDHVRRFGPAILYATEAFESYNHVIRLRSIHSTRQAPSTEIAQSFSHLHAIRHLASGGAFFHHDNPRVPCFAGSRVVGLLKDKHVAHLMGMGSIWEDESQRRLFRPAPGHVLVAEPALDGGEPSGLQLCKSLTLLNGDAAKAGSFIVFKHAGQLRPGQVMEILAHPEQLCAHAVRVQPYTVGPLELPYRFHAAVKDNAALPLLIPFEVGLIFECAEDAQPDRTLHRTPWA
jgi:hypothetical protein